MAVNVAEAVVSDSSTPFTGGDVASATAPSLAALTYYPPPVATFEPQMPDTGIIVAQGLVLVLTVAAAGYWWLVVVPSERAALGRSKRLGPLNSYLEGLETPEAEQKRWLERWFYTDWLRQRQERRRRPQPHQHQQRSTGTPSDISAATKDSDSVVVDGAPSEDPYATMQPDDPNLLRPAASTPTPRFLSLDNPIVATGALLLLAALSSGLLQH